MASVSSPVSSSPYFSTFSTPSPASPYQSLHSTFPSRSLPKRKMSISQTYYLAHTARNKLAKEASQADHQLRLLVGHANLLDSLTADLANAEREQERWFNQTVSNVSSVPSDEPRHIKWADTIAEQPEEECESDSDSETSDDSDYDETDVPLMSPALRRAPSPVAIITERETYDDLDDLEEDDEEDFERLTLTRSPSRQSPPDLLQDSDDDSEEDLMPPSPPQPSFDHFSEKDSSDMIYPKSPSLSDSEQSAMFEQGYYVSARNAGPMIQSF